MKEAKRLFGKSDIEEARDFKNQVEFNKEINSIYKHIRKKNKQVNKINDLINKINL